MGYSTLKNSGLTIDELLSNVKSLLTGKNEIYYDIQYLDNVIKTYIGYGLDIFNSECYKNHIKEINADFIILGIVETYSSDVQTYCYQKVSTRSWYNISKKQVYSIDGLSNLLKHVDLLIKNGDDEKIFPDISKVILIALNIGDELEKVNIKKNDNLLNNDIFLKLKEDNYFGITELKVVPYGVNCRRNKVDQYHYYSFKKELFDVELSCPFFKIDKSLDIENIMKKYYILNIKYLTINDDGTSEEKILVNGECEEEISDYIAKRIDDYADIFRLYGLKETY